MKKNKYFLYKSVSVLLVAFLFLMTGCSGQTTTGALHIETAEVVEGAIETSLQITGVLLPNEMVNISAKLSGEVQTADYNIGDQVKAGDVLFQLDTRGVDAQLEQAQAGLVSAQSAYDVSRKQVETLLINLETAGNTYKDTKTLYETGAVSETQMIDAKTKYDLAKKQVENANGPQQNQASSSIATAQASIHTLQVQKENAQISSPIDGVVITRGVQVGEVASPGVPLMTIADMSTLKMKGTIQQEYIPYLMVGQSIPIRVDIYPDQVFTGKILTVGPMSVSTGKIFPVEIALDNDMDLMAGLSAGATLNMVGQAHPVIPKGALISSEGETYVFVIVEGKAIKKAVVPGLNNQGSVEILTGLEVGETIAITNTHILQDQMNVISKQ